MKNFQRDVVAREEYRDALEAKAWRLLSDEYSYRSAAMLNECLDAAGFFDKVSTDLGLLLCGGASTERFREGAMVRIRDKVISHLLGSKADELERMGWSPGGSGE